VRRIDASHDVNVFRGIVVVAAQNSVRERLGERDGEV
jgi:hypothetical protein